MILISLKTSYTAYAWTHMMWELANPILMMVYHKMALIVPVPKEDNGSNNNTRGSDRRRMVNITEEEIDATL